MVQKVTNVLEGVVETLHEVRLRPKAPLPKINMINELPVDLAYAEASVSR